MATSNTVILITGANSGIGYETATTLSAVPNYHVIVGARSTYKGQEAVRAIKEQNPKGTLSHVVLDVTDQESIDAAASQVTQDHGRLDVLINNAGISIAHSTPLITKFRETFETNTFGPAIVTETFLPLLRKSSSPRLIYVSSSVGSIAIRADPNDPAFQVMVEVYRMSKAALNMLAVCNHVQYGPEGVKVWTYCPGYVVTNLGGLEKQEQKRRGAGDPKNSARGLLEIVEGKRDGDVGKFVHGNGTYPW